MAALCHLLIAHANDLNRRMGVGRGLAALLTFAPSLSTPTPRARASRRRRSIAVAVHAMLPASIHGAFDAHVAQLRQHAKRRRDANLFLGVTQTPRAVRDAAGGDKGRAGSVVCTSSAECAGDTNLRTLRQLLETIDARGWERSAHQVNFHNCFERCVSRVLYRDSWKTRRPEIMKKNNWTTTPSEVMISTPRRFGKTFRSDGSDRETLRRTLRLAAGARSHTPVPVAARTVCCRVSSHRVRCVTTASPSSVRAWRWP